MDAQPPTLLDPSLNEQLHRDGFVSFPLVDSSVVADLRRDYGTLHGWKGEGFVSDLTQEDRKYRSEADAAISESLDAAVTAKFANHEPFLRNFLCKFPGEESGLYLHRDWMYVDERQGHRTYVAWVALEDIEGDNGQLRVLRRSHSLDRQLRGTDLISPWLEHTEVIEPRLLSVPVRAGDCVVFDNGLAHCSYPNYTSKPRVVAAVGVRSPGTPLVHFRRADATTAERFDIDETFFLTATPQELIAAAPDLPVRETVAIDAWDPSADELAALLDEGLRARIDLARNRFYRWAGQARDSAVAQRDKAKSTVQQRAASAPRTPGSDASAPTLRSRAATAVQDLPTRAAITVLGWNELAINRFGPETPAVWDPSDFPWTATVEAAFPAIRQEVEALLDGPTEIPHIEDVTGGIPQGNVGPWRSFVLMHQGRWIDWNCDRCPQTTAAVKRVPGLTMAGFSLLEAGTHITEHRGPNKGALRYQLGVVVPGREGDCRIRVDGEMLTWSEGASIMFDFTAPHEAWNDSPGRRVLLMLEVLAPLPWYLSGVNRLAQRAMGWFPTTRDIKRRLAKLEPSLSKT